MMVWAVSLNSPRPDSTGTTISYSGFDQTITDVTSDGTGGSTIKRYGVLGHLVELHEHHSGDSTAITRYLYDANDNLKQITDAEENITRLTHDWLGNRLSVSRG
ncbi:hypothetical protein [Rhodohalobacter sp.]|uniref:hypothetical protein n=1 Tax=Rhodohalobacter sp. TaxID=1974210 RepID=UPI002ACEB8CB|nr:hypothetical protein [Rhodohalobacter sp.]MDZ7757524.1 hypothetical protein [Rhodohalobacter sp.]